jgi:hypothetical protein
MRPGQEVAIGFAAVFFVLTLWREAIWFRRFSGWQKVDGVVEGINTFGDGPGCPIIGYSVGGTRKTFQSSVCLYNPRLGETVVVLFDPKSNAAVMLTKRHRWFLTAFCGAFSIAMLGIAALSH